MLKDTAGGGEYNTMRSWQDEGRCATLMPGRGGERRKTQEEGEESLPAGNIDRRLRLVPGGAPGRRPHW